MQILIFAPSGRHTPDALPGLADTDRVTVICWDTPDAEGLDDRVTLRQSASSARAVAALSRSLPGRMLVRLLPLDNGARFWRASVRVPEVQRRVLEADLIIAAERDGGFAAWNWLHRAARSGSTPAVVRGYAAARARISRP